MKKVYVAGKTDDYVRVRQAQVMCRATGLEVTFDWTQVVEEIGAKGGLKGEVSDEFRRECAYNDLNGVRIADLCVAVVDFPGLCGTLIEVGIAAELELPTIIVGKPERDSVFFELDNITRCDSLNALPDVLEDEFGLVPNEAGEVAIDRTVG